jgi:hypothetical protein
MTITVRHIQCCLYFCLKLLQRGFVSFVTMWFSRREYDSPSTLAPGFCTAWRFRWECAVRLRGVEPGRWRHRPAGCGVGSEMSSSPLAGCVGDSRPLGEWCWQAALQASVHTIVVVLLGGQTTLLLSGSPPTILLLLGRRQIIPRVPELAITPCSAGAGCPWDSRTDWPFLVCRAAESFLMLQLDISSWCWSWLVLDRSSSWRRRWLNESRLELWPLFIQSLRCSTYPAIG